MAVNKKNIMTRYFFVVLLMGLVGIAIVVKGAMIMFAERQYWHDVADRFVKENVTVKPETVTVTVTEPCDKEHVY